MILNHFEWKEVLAQSLEVTKIQHTSDVSAQGDIYITIQGGQDVAEQATRAFLKGAVVIPVIATGGASQQLRAGAVVKS